MNNKIAIGCLVQWYEVEMVEDYLISLRNAVRRVSPRRNVQIDICLNLNEGLEKLDTSKKSMYEIERKFLDMVQEILSGCHYVYWKTEIDIYTIADYRRDFNRSYCKSADVLMWGESDSLIPEQAFQVLDYLHNEVKEATPKYVATFGINKMWDDSWKPLEHVEFTDKPFIEADTKNWWSIPYTMNIEEMDAFNDKVEDLDIQQTTQLKFNGCGLVISSDVVKSGCNIPKSVFFVHEDTSFMNNCLIHFRNQLPQYIIKNILLVHNRKLPNKRMYIKGQDIQDGDMTEMRKKQYWFPNADKMSQMNAFNTTEQGYTFTWEDVFREYEN